MEKGEMTVRDAGKLGGLTCRDRHPDLYARIGKLGGQAVKAKYASEYYSRIGKLGGRAKRHAALAE